MPRHVTPATRYDDDDDRYEAYPREDAPRRRASPPDPLVRQALDWGISGSILAILILTALYVFSPLDAIPDLIPIAGQADDVAAVLSGSGAVAFLAVLRFVLRTRVGRWGCLFAIVLSSIGGFTVFWLLYQVFNALV